MFESIMSSSRVNKITCSKLLQVPKSLELWSINNPHTEGIKLNAAMNRVIKNFFFTTKEKYRFYILVVYGTGLRIGCVPIYVSAVRVRDLWREQPNICFAKSFVCFVLKKCVTYEKNNYRT